MSICATNTYGFLPGWWWLQEAGYHLMKSDQLTQHPSYSWQSDFVIKIQFIIPVGVFLSISPPPIHFSWSHSIVFLSVDNRPMAPVLTFQRDSDAWCSKDKRLFHMYVSVIKGRKIHICVDSPAQSWLIIDIFTSQSQVCNRLIEIPQVSCLG